MTPLELITLKRREARRAIELGICSECNEPPHFYSEAGRREYQISGLCEYCFDRLTADNTYES